MALTYTRPANDNERTLIANIDRAISGQALTISQAHRKFGRCYAEFVGHAGDGKHILVRKLITSMWKGRWSKPLKVERVMVLSVHTRLAQTV